MSDLCLRRCPSFAAFLGVCALCLASPASAREERGSPTPRAVLFGGGSDLPKSGFHIFGAQAWAIARQKNPTKPVKPVIGVFTECSEQHADERWRAAKARLLKEGRRYGLLEENILRIGKKWNTPDAMEKIASLDAFYVTGGDQSRGLGLALGDNGAGLEVLRRQVATGQVVLGGTSAGATWVGRKMVTGGRTDENGVEYSDGAGLLSHLLIDTHAPLRKREPRGSQLSLAVNQVVTALDENAAVYVSGCKLHVVAGYVARIDGRNARQEPLPGGGANIEGARVSYLPPGSKVDLETGLVSPPHGFKPVEPQKRPVPTEAWNLPRRKNQPEEQVVEVPKPAILLLAQNLGLSRRQRAVGVDGTYHFCVHLKKNDETQVLGSDKHPDAPLIKDLSMSFRCIPEKLSRKKRAEQRAR